MAKLTDILDGKKTIGSGLVSILAGISILLDMDFNTAEIEAWVGSIGAVLGGIGAIVGRLHATKIFVK